MQFGKMRDNIFALDYGWPFSGLQAIACAISSLHHKAALR